MCVNPQQQEELEEAYELLEEEQNDDFQRHQDVSGYSEAVPP
jgi:hypothetical protein